MAFVWLVYILKRVLYKKPEIYPTGKAVKRAGYINHRYSLIFTTSINNSRKPLKGYTPVGFAAIYFMIGLLT